ncbi:hypothetical protein R1A27_34520 (plasmid) [Methylobacterium sp. NMS12]|uniref:hypothetical protein n=1 Tax=Methylobacterium sp. NMS12 TaxID=3079766 RepID=UPI003F8818DF
MPSLKLPKLFRSTEAASSLKERAASLKTELHTLAARPNLPSPLPAPGSDEAITAWEKARSEFDRLTNLSSAEYAALRIGDTGTLWTTGWVKAIQRGDFTRFTPREMAAARGATAAELADLLVITTRRDLRFAEAQRRTAVRELYALAYPEGEDPASEPDPEGDYAHVLIAEHRAAYAAWVPHLDAISKAKGGSDEFRAAEEAGAAVQSAEQDAFGELIDVQPTTLGGLIALAGYVPEAIRLNGISDADNDAVHALHSICNGIIKLTESGKIAALTEADPTDWGAPPPGFMAYPERDPMSFVNIRHGLRLELERLHGIATTEFQRRAQSYRQNATEEAARHHEAVLRAQLFLAPLTAAVDSESGRTCALTALDRPAEADPILAAITASRRAEAEMGATEAAFGGRRMTDAEQAREDAAERDQKDTRAAVWSTVPTTAEGRAALARYVAFQLKLTFGPDWRAKMEQEFCGDAVLALIAAIGAETVSPASATLDLRDASIVQLARLLDHMQSLAFIASTAVNAPMAWDGKRQNLNSIGRLLEAVHVYLDELAERVVVEISARVPTDNIDRDDRLSALVKRQMEVAAAVEDPAIMAEITKAWGG